jgi:hypothetical protein
MDLNPPEGSKIWIASEGGDPTICVPQASGFGRYFVGFFLLFWLGMWTIGFRSAVAEIMSGRTANGFLVFWLGAWTLGGIVAAYTLYRAFRPLVPETLALKRNSVLMIPALRRQSLTHPGATGPRRTAGTKCSPSGFGSNSTGASCNHCACGKPIPATD